MEEKNTNIIIHKSNWYQQIILSVIGLIIIFSLVVKNPDELVFAKELIKEYSLKKGVSGSNSQIISNLAVLLGGDILKLPIERNDFIFFSYFSFEFEEIKVNAIGVLGEIYILNATYKPDSIQNSDPLSELDNILAKYPCVDDYILPRDGYYDLIMSDNITKYPAVWENGRLWFIKDTIKKEKISEVKC